MGRWSYSHRDVLENSGRFDISEIMQPIKKVMGKDYHLEHSWETEITSTKGGYTEKTASAKWTLSFQCDDPYSDKNFISYELIYKGNNYKGLHTIAAEPVHMGGFRYYFKCCCYKRGIPCYRRVKSLYFGWTVWACRHCLELVYSKSRYHRDYMFYQYTADNIRKRAKKLRKCKHPRKANILEKRADAYERKHWNLY